MKKKLLYLYLEPFKPGHGGYSHASGIIKYLKNYYDIIFFSPAYKANLPLPTAVKRFLYIMLTQIKAIMVLPRIHYVYVRCHFLGIVLFMMSYLMRKPIILEVNGPITDAYVHWKVNFLTRKLIQLSYVTQLKLCDKIIVVTPQLKQYFLNHYHIDEKKIEIVPNAGEKLDQTVRQQQKISFEIVQEKYAIYMGSLTNWQGIETLLEAVSLKDVWPQDLFLYICGNGPLLQTILQAEAKNPLIKYRGLVVSDHDKYHYYTNSLCSIIPKNNLFDRMKTGLSPIKLYESLAHGVPVIVTDLPYQAELVKENNLGIVIAYDSPLRLAEAVKELYSNSSLRETLVNNAFHFIDNGNSWDHRAQQTHEIISSL